jgi:hypothetical protein
MSLLFSVDAGSQPDLGAAPGRGLLTLGAGYSTAATALEDRVRTEYARHLELYERRLGPPSAGNRRLRLPPPLEGGPELVFDRSLFSQLCFLYLTHGWSGVAAAEKVAAGMGRPVEGGLPGGTRVTGEQQAAWEFFVATQNLLGLLVRQALVDLEAQAAAVVTQAVRQSKELLDAGWSQLDVRLGPPKPATPTRDATGDPGRPFVFGDTDLSTAVHDTLVKAAKERRLLDAVLRALRLQGRWRREAGDPDDPDLTYGQWLRINASRSEEERIRLVADLCQANLNAMRGVLAVNCPVALLAFLTVQPSTTRPDLEHQLGSILDRLRTTAAAMKRVPMGGRVQHVLPMKESTLGLPQLRMPLEGPERAVLSAARQHQGADPSWSPLLHEATWHHLVGAGAIPKDGLTYVVAYHYRRALIEERIAEEAHARAREDASRSNAMTVAVLGLATLFAPALGALALVALAEAVSLTATVVGLAVTVSSLVEVVGQLRVMDLRIGESLAAPGGAGTETLSEIGSLAKLRSDLPAQVLGQLALGLILQSLGTRLPKAELALLGYGYYQDLETLLGHASGGAP